ncbi:MAG: class I SAM-dependent methyltransferase [Bryobacter sp.]|nr:class I SAM-dependent methyltransferase [Bryobacter sp.]
MNPAEFSNIARAEEHMWWFRGMRAILHAWVERAGKPSFKRVLEAGCGTGYMSAWMQREFGWPVTPLDLDFGGLSHSQLPRRTQGDITSLPFRNNSFDALVSLDVVVHLPRGEEARAFAEFARVLGPGGTLLLRTSALDILRSRHSQFAHERQRFTAGRLAHGLTQAGFTVEHLSYANAFLVPVALAKFRLWEPLTNAPPASGVEVPPAWLNWLLTQPLRLEAGLLRRGFRFPVGQSLLVWARRL